MILLLLGPSGAGKKTFKVACKDHGIRIIKSYTTKPLKTPKDAEVYQQVTNDQFKKLIAEDAMLEWVEYAGHKYGTLRNDFTKNCVTIVDTTAYYKLKEYYKGKVFTIYFDMSDEARRKTCLDRGEDLDLVEKKIKADNEKLKHFNKSQVDLVLTDKDIGRFDEIIKENRSKWVVR